MESLQGRGNMPKIKSTEDHLSASAAGEVKKDDSLAPRPEVGCDCCAYEPFDALKPSDACGDHGGNGCTTNGDHIPCAPCFYCGAHPSPRTNPEEDVAQDDDADDDKSTTIASAAAAAPVDRASDLGVLVSVASLTNNAVIPAYVPIAKKVHEELVPLDFYSCNGCHRKIEMTHLHNGIAFAPCGLRPLCRVYYCGLGCYMADYKEHATMHSTCEFPTRPFPSPFRLEYLLQSRRAWRERKRTRQARLKMHEAARAVNDAMETTIIVNSNASDEALEAYNDVKALHLLVNGMIEYTQCNGMNVMMDDTEREEKLSKFGIFRQTLSDMEKSFYCSIDGPNALATVLEIKQDIEALVHSFPSACFPTLPPLPSELDASDKDYTCVVCHVGLDVPFSPCGVKALCRVHYCGLTCAVADYQRHDLMHRGCSFPPEPRKMKFNLADAEQANDRRERNATIELQRRVQHSITRIADKFVQEAILARPGAGVQELRVYGQLKALDRLIVGLHDYLQHYARGTLNDLVIEEKLMSLRQVRQDLNALHDAEVLSMEGVMIAKKKIANIMGVSFPSCRCPPRHRHVLPSCASHVIVDPEDNNLPFFPASSVSTTVVSSTASFPACASTRSTAATSISSSSTHGDDDAAVVAATAATLASRSSSDLGVNMHITTTTKVETSPKEGEGKTGDEGGLVVTMVEALGTGKGSNDENDTNSMVMVKEEGSSITTIPGVAGERVVNDQDIKDSSSLPGHRAVSSQVVSMSEAAAEGKEDDEATSHVLAPSPVPFGTSVSAAVEEEEEDKVAVIPPASSSLFLFSLAGSVVKLPFRVAFTTARITTAVPRYVVRKACQATLSSVKTTINIATHVASIPLQMMTHDVQGSVDSAPSTSADNHVTVDNPPPSEAPVPMQVISGDDIQGSVDSPPSSAAAPDHHDSVDNSPPSSSAAPASAVSSLTYRVISQFYGGIHSSVSRCMNTAAWLGHKVYEAEVWIINKSIQAVRWVVGLPLTTLRLIHGGITQSVKKVIKAVRWIATLPIQVLRKVYGTVSTSIKSLFSLPFIIINKLYRFMDGNITSLMSGAEWTNETMASIYVSVSSRIHALNQKINNSITSMMTWMHQKKISASKKIYPIVTIWLYVATITLFGTVAATYSISTYLMTTSMHIGSRVYKLVKALVVNGYLVLGLTFLGHPDHIR